VRWSCSGNGVRILLPSCAPARCYRVYGHRFLLDAPGIVAMAAPLHVSRFPTGPPRNATVRTEAHARVHQPRPPRSSHGPAVSDCNNQTAPSGKREAKQAAGQAEAWARAGPRLAAVLLCGRGRRSAGEQREDGTEKSIPHARELSEEGGSLVAGRSAHSSSSTLSSRWWLALAREGVSGDCGVRRT
jgi:hypothetical protein